MTHEHQTCVDACIACAQACERCATSCLGETNVEAMSECIRLDRDCAEMCWMAAAFMSRGSQFAPDVCHVCAETCNACANECAKHDADHCRKCAEACRHCEEECRRMAVIPV